MDDDRHKRRREGGSQGTNSQTSRTSVARKRRKSTSQPERSIAPNVLDSGGGSGEEHDSDTDNPPSPPGQVVATVATPGAGARWNAMDTNRLELTRDARTIEVYVKDVFFRRCKFIRDKAEMDFDISAQSICQTVCGGCNVPGARQRDWWRFAGPKVDKYLNKKRSDTNATMKRKFLGKTTPTRS